jgi:hypothetical protein
MSKYYDINLIFFSLKLLFLLTFMQISSNLDVAQAYEASGRQLEPVVAQLSTVLRKS